MGHGEHQEWWRGAWCGDGWEAVSLRTMRLQEVCLVVGLLDDVSPYLCASRDQLSPERLADKNPVGSWGAYQAGRGPAMAGPDRAPPRRPPTAEQMIGLHPERSAHSIGGSVDETSHGLPRFHIPLSPRAAMVRPRTSRRKDPCCGSKRPKAKPCASWTSETAVRTALPVMHNCSSGNCRSFPGDLRGVTSRHLHGEALRRISWADPRDTGRHPTASAELHSAVSEEHRLLSP